MKQITDILMSKQFLIGVGVGVAGVYLYNRYMAKEPMSNAGGSSTDQCCYDYDTDRCGVVEGACSDYGYTRSNCCAKYFRK